MVAGGQPFGKQWPESQYFCPASCSFLGCFSMAVSRDGIRLCVVELV